MVTKFLEKDPEGKERYARTIPMGRIGLVDDVIGATVFLASEASSYVTGQIIYPDGGLTAVG
jgi:gluconate 5-dehydrogenase